MMQEDSLKEKIAELLNEMTLEEKISLLAGVDKWHTRGIERLGIPSMKMTDGAFFSASVKISLRRSSLWP